MGVFRNWHFEAFPKLEFAYFTERLQKQGNTKEMKSFMSRMRNVYKGVEVIDGFLDTQPAGGVSDGSKQKE